MKTTTYSTVRTIALSIFSLILMTVVIAPITTRAMVDTSPIIDPSPIVVPVVLADKPADKKDTQEQDTKSDVAPADTSTASSTEPISSTTPATTPSDSASTTAPVATTATTTPTEQRENQAQKDTPGTDATYNQTVEDILNTVVAPIKKPTRATSTALKSKQTTASSTPIVVSPTASSTNTASTSNSQSATSTAGVFNRTTTGGTNQSAAANYYTPLDTLSPEMTYALSALAMIFGIIGATLIIKDPEERLVWSPALSEQSLLES